MNANPKNYHFFTPYDISRRERQRKKIGNFFSIIFLLAGLYLLFGFAVCRWSTEQFQDVSGFQLWAMGAGAFICLVLSYLSPLITHFLIWVPERRLTIRK